MGISFAVLPVPASQLRTDFPAGVVIELENRFSQAEHAVLRELVEPDAEEVHGNTTPLSTE